MNLTPLQRLLPEWEFIENENGTFRWRLVIGHHEGMAFGKNAPSKQVAVATPWQVSEDPDDCAVLESMIERALLKMEGVDWLSILVYGDGGAEVQVGGRTMSNKRGATKLKALLAVIERLPGLGGEEKE